MSETSFQKELKKTTRTQQVVSKEQDEKTRKLAEMIFELLKDELIKNAHDANYITEDQDILVFSAFTSYITLAFRNNFDDYLNPIPSRYRSEFKPRDNRRYLIFLETLTELAKEDNIVIEPVIKIHGMFYEFPMVQYGSNWKRVHWDFGFRAITVTAPKNVEQERIDQIISKHLINKPKKEEPIKAPEKKVNNSTKTVSPENDPTTSTVGLVLLIFLACSGFAFLIALFSGDIF